MGTTHLLSLVLVFSNLDSIYSKIWEIPLPAHLQDCYNRVQTASVDSYVGSTYSWLCENHMKKSPTQEGLPTYDTAKTGYYKHLYDKYLESAPHVGPGRGKRQAPASRCNRKEYRMMSDDERIKFHTAVNALKQDTTVEPNKYDAIALLHSGPTNFIAHGGPGFLGWHRIYLLIFETALREVDPTVCVPYWDSSLDNQLADPTSSLIWSPQFLGTSQGAVVEGPFANWVTPEGGQLIRNVGSDGDLFTTTAIADILSRTRHEDIMTSETSEPQYDLEFHHAAVHVYVGGAMTRLDTAAFDPVFFMHHAFIDYVWELFRTNLRGLNVSPETYPVVTNVDPRHVSTAPTGFGDLTQADGYLDSLTESFFYEPVPVCSARSPDCGSRYLVCQLSTGRCIASTRTTQVVPTPLPMTTVAPGPSPTPVILPPNSTSGDTCRKPTYGLPIQNDYCCDKTCDTNQWALIPVKIISVRPPKYQAYNSYPVTAGHVDKNQDIYAPKAYTQTEKYIASKQSNPKTYKRCEKDVSTGQIFIYSRGINYAGHYKESSIVDQRLAVSISMGFVGVKKPSPGEGGVSKALIRAHDSCGRVCHVACKDPATNEYKECSGAIAISEEAPNMYGLTYDDAFMSVFDYQFNSDCPKFKTENFFLTFYCDYHDKFPYAQPTQTPPTPTPAPTPTPVVDHGTGCRVSKDCTIDVPCYGHYRQCSKYNERHMCKDSCSTYVACTYGHYFVRRCPIGQYFDETANRCVYGYCQPGSPRKICLPYFRFHRLVIYIIVILKINYPYE
ncbi:prephenate dehydrogenase (NADP(+)) [Bulinus truncatus]|nr:prephenate dehydrogenase (NADP(+)) [Bulinus truncatus]